jgi:hypothetical protein
MEVGSNASSDMARDFVYFYFFVRCAIRSMAGGCDS